MTQVPALIRLPGPIANRLLRSGIPMGPNRVLTVRGRTSGLPRSAPVAVVEFRGRRWVVGTFGEVHWVRNLRAAREATLRIGRRDVSVQAVELDRDEATAFFRDLLPDYLASLPPAWRLLMRLLIRVVS